jgi:hypothetical protein
MTKPDDKFEFFVDEDVLLKVAYEVWGKSGFMEKVPIADLVQMTREAAKIIMREEGWPGSI